MTDEAYEQQDKRGTSRRTSCSGKAEKRAWSQSSKTIDNIDFPSHAWVSVAMIIDDIWPRVVWSQFHICWLASL